MAPKAKRGSRNNGGNGGDDDDDEGTGGELFNDEQRTELGNLINAAVSGQLSRKLPSAIKGALDEGLAPIKELLERGAGGKQRPAGDDDDEDEDLEDQRPARGRARGKQRDDDEQRGARKDPKVNKLEQEVAKMRTEREQERAQMRNRERDSMLREELSQAGVDPNRMRGAVAVLRDALVYDDKAGEWTYRTKRDGIDEDLDVSAGVSEWAGTDEGKSYLAPKQGTQTEQRRGAGTRVQTQTRTQGGGVINRGNPAADAKAAKATAKAEAYKALGGAINELGGATIGVG